MPTPLTWLDRLRVERAVWTVDVLISALPARRQRAILGELRSNLTAAAAEVGIREALRRLGGLRQLAGGYLDAELGEGRPRPSWLRGLLWALAVEAVLLAATFAGNQAFMDGVRAGDPNATGTYAWHALAPLVPGETVTLHDGAVGSLGLTFWAPGVVLICVAAFALGARVWRLRRA
jgi:hypothetical protein